AHYRVMFIHFFLCFFFQAEDGIRDRTVTGVQTCALPIWQRVVEAGRISRGDRLRIRSDEGRDDEAGHHERDPDEPRPDEAVRGRSEERRVGKEWRAGGGGEQEEGKGMYRVGIGQQKTTS